MARHEWTDEELEQQMSDAASRKANLDPNTVIERAFFEPHRREFVLTMKSRHVMRVGVDLHFAWSLATNEQLSNIELQDDELYLPALDDGAHVLALRDASYGPVAWRRELVKRLGEDALRPVPLDPPGTEEAPPRPVSERLLSRAELLRMHHAVAPELYSDPKPEDLFPEAGPDSTQGAVIAGIRSHVDAWRGFALGPAREAYPEEAPRYEPRQAWERVISSTTMTLLQHWFRREPHVLLNGQPFKYWPHQRRAVETFIYLHEVCGVRRTEDLWRIGGGRAIDRQRDPWAKLGGELATGSGKTKVMSLLIAWSYLNSLFQGESYLGLGRHALIVAPGLFVRDRLLLDFRPDDGTPSIFLADPVLPPGFREVWTLRVYGPEDCPRRLPAGDGALVVTNYHRLLNEDEDTEDDLAKTRSERQLDLLVSGEPRKLEDVKTPLVECFHHSRGLLVINDEGHRVGDEPAHVRAELKAKSKADGSVAEKTAWIRALKLLNGSPDKSGRLGLQVDLSATLFEEAGIETDQKTLFRHTAVQYELREAKQDGIIKTPVLELVKASSEGQQVASIDEGAPNAWARYRVLIEAGIERWKKVLAQMRAEGDPRKPILMLLCENQEAAAEIANMLTYREPTRAVTGIPIQGWRDRTGETLFVEDDGQGGKRSTVVQVHIGEKELKNEKEWAQVRRLVHFIDRDEVPGVGLDAAQRPIRIPNPYNVVVSVLMLREGWDVRNVKVIVPLRECGSRTLTEQVLGRGLRKMRAPRMDDDGNVELEPEQLFVIEHPSFAKILDKLKDIVDEKDPDEIQHDPEYVPIRPRPVDADRAERDVRLVRYLGTRDETPDWRRDLKAETLPALHPRLLWQGRQPDIDVETRLREAFRLADVPGLEFSLARETTYLDFERVLTHVYVNPILKTLGAGLHHRTALKGVVRDFLERKTFHIGEGLRPAFEGGPDDEAIRIALGNVTRADVVERVKQTLVPIVHAALTAARTVTRVQLGETRAMDLPGYSAIRKNVVEDTQRSPFERQATLNDLEERVARWIDGAPDTTGWVYNHRKGVGYGIQYEWMGLMVPYYPDFIVRTKQDHVFHNFVVEAKGRLDKRDERKARAGVEFCELLTSADAEPWHYLLLIENEGIGRRDMTLLESASTPSFSYALTQQEKRGLLPGGTAQLLFEEVRIEEDVEEAAKWRGAVPAYDLNAEAGGFGPSTDAKPQGWVRLRTARRLDRSMFCAKVSGHSMEPSVPAGSWCLFRAYPPGAAPSAVQMDGRRVIVELRDEHDAESGGRYTLKRLKVMQLDEAGAAREVELLPENTAFKRRRLSAADGPVRIAAELLEIVG